MIRFFSFFVRTFDPNVFWMSIRFFDYFFSCAILSLSFSAIFLSFLFYSFSMFNLFNIGTSILNIYLSVFFRLLVFCLGSQAPKPQISMPNSFPSKPGFYDEPNADRSSDSKSSGDKKSNQKDGKKKTASQNAGNDSKGFVVINFHIYFLFKRG